MSAHDISMKHVGAAAAVLVLAVAAAIGAVFALLRTFDEPAGGRQSGAAELVPSLRAAGPALQSAPQIDAAAERARQANRLAAVERPR